MSASFAYVPPEVTSMMGVLDTYLRWEATRDKPRGYLLYHPSAFGKCLREQQYLRFMEEGLISVQKEEPNSRFIRTMDIGHTMHDRWAGYWEEIGVLRGYWRCENPICGYYLDDGTPRNDVDLSDLIQNKVVGTRKGFEVAWNGGKTLFPYQFEKINWKGGMEQEFPVRWSDARRWYGRGELQGSFKPEKCACGYRRFKYHELDVYSEKLNFFGHCDQILDFSNFKAEKFEGVVPSFKADQLPKKPIVVDMKTINDFRYKQLLQSGPSVEYRVQLTIYANLLDCEYGVLIYENKNNSDTASFKVERNSDTVFASIERQALKLNELAQFRKLPPPRPTDKDDWECKDCPFATLCHKAGGAWDDPKLAERRKAFYGKLLAS